MRVELLCIGTELLSGKLNTNSSYIAARLPALGIDLYWISQVGDNLGRLLETDDGGFITSYGYDEQKFGGSVFDSSGFKPNAVTDPRGVTTTMVFDDLYRALEKRVSGIAGFTSTVYDNAGNPLSVTDPLNRTTQFVYDVDGQVVETTFPDLTKNKVYYTHTGKPWKQVNELNAETITQYDAAGRAVKVIQPAVNGFSPITEMFYDSANNAVKAKDALGRATITEYDARNRPYRVMTPIVWDAVAGQGVHPMVETEYDSLGQVTLQRDPMGRESRKFYDRAGRAWRSVNALDHEVVSTFDPAGNVLTMTQKVTNAEGSLVDQTVTNVYDTHYRLTSSLDGEAILNEFEYDEAGNRTLVRDGLGQETSFVYDELGRLVTQTFKKDLATTADDDTWSYVYDAVHKLSQTDAAGVVTSYGYDLRSRLETVTVAGELLRTYDYDSAGRLESVVENGHPESDVSYSYDALGRTTSETSRGVTHTYHYDLVGNRVLAELGTGRNIQTIYDSLNRPELILESEGTAEAGSSETRITQYGYDLAGRAVLLKPANGQVTENIYDELGRLTNRTLFKRMSDRSDSGVLAEFGWSYNEVGNVTAQYETWPGTPERPAGIRTTVMTYDLANRLAKETITDGATGVTETSYTYDAANNRKTKTVTGGSEPGHWVYDYNAGNQLMTWSKYNGVEGKLRKRGTQSYDANGNRTSETKVNLSVNEEHASLSNQGITYQAVAEGEYGEDLSVSLNAAAVGQTLSAAMIGGNHVAVTLETDMGVPDTLVNQGITYSTPTEHQPGHEVSVALVAEAPDQTPGVVVNGTDIQVTLETGVGAKAHASDQGLVYEAATAGVGGNALSVRLEKAEVDEPASANIQGDEVVVRLATDDGQPDGLVDQGITYTTKDAHQDGREVTVELVAAESEQTPSVQVTGDNVKVFLETGVGSSASANSQGISYASNLPGQEGNELKVHYSLASPYLETPEPLSMWTGGHDVWVSLANEGGQAATLELPGITYQAVPIGENGNGMTVSHVTAEAPDMPTVVSSVVGDHVTIQLGTGPALPARAGLYDVTLQAIDPGEDGNGITVTVEAPSSYPSYYLETSVDGKNIHVMLARDDDGNIMSRYYDVVLAIQTAASHLVTVVEGQGSYSEVAEPCFIVLEGAGTGYSMNATAGDVSSALTSNPAAAALLTVINGDGNVLWEVFDDATSGGVDPVVTSTVDDVVALLANHPEVLPLMSVTGSGTAPMQPGVVSLTGGGEDFEILSPVSEIVTLLNAENSPAKDLLTAAGSGETLLQALPRTVLAGGVEPAIVTTATDVATLLENHSLITASGTGTTPLQPGVVPLTGGGEDFEILTQAHEVVTWLTAENSPALSLVNVTGAGETSLLALPRTVLAGGRVHQSLTTADEVVSLISGITPLMSITGGGSVELSPLPQTHLGGVTSATTVTTTYAWTPENRLREVDRSDGKNYGYSYDYRIRRVGTRATENGQAKHTAILFSGGLSTAEYESTALQTDLSEAETVGVQYVRGPDMGGGVGGLLYSVRSETSGGQKIRYNLSNGRGDIVAQSDGNATLTWTASYEAYGKRPAETGTNEDKQRANSKDEDPTGLLNEGFRYRDLETGVWMSRDPAGFVDGPNLYAYVKQNPWTSFDPLGLEEKSVNSSSKKENVKTNANKADSSRQSAINKNPTESAKTTYETGKTYVFVYGEDTTSLPLREAAEKMATETKTNPEDKVIVRPIKGFNDFNKILKEEQNIAEINYFGHGGPGILFVGLGSGADTNISLYGGDHTVLGGVNFNSRGVHELDKSNVRSDVKMGFYSCFSAFGNSQLHSQEIFPSIAPQSIAGRFVEHFGGTARGAVVGTKFKSDSTPYSRFGFWNQSARPTSTSSSNFEFGGP